MNKLILIVTALSLSACTGSFSLGSKHRDKPADFKERRALQENIFISTGGMKKKPAADPMIESTAASAANSLNQSDGFSQKTLNISKTKSTQEKVAVTQLDDSILLACNDPAMHKEIDESTVRDQDIEKSKSKDWTPLKDIPQDKNK